MSPLLQDVDEAGAVKVGVAKGADVDPDERLLSVVEIQQAFRELRARRPRVAARGLAAPPPLHVPSVSEDSAPAAGVPVLSPPRTWLDGDSAALPAREEIPRELSLIHI